MPFNGSGVFSRVMNWVTDAANGIPMTASRFDTDANDMANGLSQCLTRGGQSAPTANLPMGGFKLTGLTPGTTAGDSVSFEQLTGLSVMSAAQYPNINLAVAAANTAGSWLYVPASYAATGSVANLHTVPKFGGGNITRDGLTFYCNPTPSQTNTLYVSPTGNDSNDGITPALPFLTLQAAVNALANYGPYLPGNWVIQLAAGTYTNGVTFPAGLSSLNYIQVIGPNSALPFIPTAIVDGSSSPTTNFAFNLNGNNNVLFQNIYVKNWTSAGNGYGWIGQEFSQLYLINCYSFNVDNHVKNQQGRTYITGGVFYTGQVGMTMISGETHSIGYGASVAGSVTLATTGASGTGTTATITFAVQSSAPVVGSTFVVQGVTPAGYNGVYTVTASTTTSVSYACTATGAQTVAGVCGYNFGVLGVGPLIHGMTVQGCLLQENATGHVDYTAVNGCGVGMDIVASSRANANFATITNSAAIGVRYRAGSNWVNQSCTLFGNPVDEASGAACPELNRAGLWTGEMRQPVDISFFTHTGTTAATTIKTYASAIASNSFNSSLKSYRMRFSGSLTGTLGTKNITVNLAGSPAAGFTLPAAYVGTYVFEVTVTAQSGSAQSVEAWCLVNGQTPVTFDGSRSIAMMTGSAIPATIVVTLGNAGDTLTCRKVDQFSTGGC